MELETYNRLLKVRGLFQQVQQASYHSNQLARRYPIEQLNEAEQEELLAAYFDLVPDLGKVVLQLESENEKYHANPTR